MICIFIFIALGVISWVLNRCCTRGLRDAGFNDKKVRAIVALPWLFVVFLAAGVNVTEALGWIVLNEEISALINSLLIWSGLFLAFNIDYDNDEQ